MGRTTTRAHVGRPIGGTRRRRSREQTRDLLLEAAARVAIDRVSAAGGYAHNPLASVRVTDALARVNAEAPEADLMPMTTGAAYHIWTDQAAFQLDLLTYVMNRTSTPGAQEIEATAHRMMQEGRPAEDVFRMISDRGFEASRAAPELFLALGIGALADPAVVREAQAAADATYVATVERLLGTVVPYAGRRLQAGRTMTELVWATEALAWGYLLRWRTHPEIALAVDGDGRSSRSSAYLGLIHAFTEPASST